jgi:hypothetical protein
MASRSTTPRVTAARLASVNTACATLDISRSFFYSLHRRGEIQTVTLGGKTYVPVRELDRIVGDTEDEAVRDE